MMNGRSEHWYKFEGELPGMIKRGEKRCTWRLFDEREVAPGDWIICCDSEGQAFARCKVLWVKETTFSNLTAEDFEFHEAYGSEEEMLDTFRGYYETPVRRNTPVRVIRFQVENPKRNNDASLILDDASPQEVFRAVKRAREDNEASVIHFPVTNETVVV